MGYQREHSAFGATVWELVERQHGVVARRQLLEIGVHAQGIKHRIATRRLHAVAQGVYAVGRPELTQHGRWMAAVLSCGPLAVLSHASAAALWGMRLSLAMELSLPRVGSRRRPGIRIHRRPKLTVGETTEHDGIPLTTPTCTLVDIACRLTRGQLERAINEADRLDLAHPEELRAAIDQMPPRRGIGVLRATLDRHTFTLTRSELERRFVPLALQAGLPMPLTRQWVNGFEVDFHWPALGLVVETDGLRYHRTPAQQARDRHRARLTQRPG